MSAQSQPTRDAADGPDFPFDWPEPGDAERYWTRDRMHRPGPMTPMELSVNALFGGGGETRLINGYLYSESKPKPPPTAEDEAREREREAETREQMGRLSQIWHHEMVPEIQAHMAFWDEFDLAGASGDELLAHWEETQERFRALWKLHRIVGPAKLAIGMLDEFYQELFGDQDTFGAYELLEGLENRSTALGLDLWRLSRQALAASHLARQLMAGEWHQVRSELSQTPAGRDFLSALADYLARHGRRSEAFGISAPSWSEDPTPVLAALRSYMGRPQRDLPQEIAESGQRRERRIAAVREQLAGYPAAVREEFDWLLAAAQAGNIVSEDHNYWIDFASFHAVRRVLLEFGRRLQTAGLLEQAADMIYLDLDDLVALARQLPTVTPTMDRRTVVAQRRAQIAAWSRLHAPAALGTPPPRQEPEDSLSHRTFGQKFLGGEAKDSGVAGLLLGNAGSPGVVQGRARVARSPADAVDLQPDEILVSVTTAPAWTPLFAVAAAVVTDTGGILSHCAVVAREYGIPAVVGTGSASRVIRSGQRIQVDGNQGTVRIL